MHTNAEAQRSRCKAPSTADMGKIVDTLSAEHVMRMSVGHGNPSPDREQKLFQLQVHVTIKLVTGAVNVTVTV